MKVVGWLRQFVCLAMADLLTSERSSLSFFAKQKSKYGSLSKNSLRRQKAINHVIQPSDTLQGIALKYGVSMEEIKRANKLWTTDSVFLRSSLSIPVPTDFSQPQSETSDGTSVSNDQNPACQSDDPQSKKENSPQNGPVIKKHQEETLNDFLVRVDSNIALTRDKVQLLEKKRSGSEVLPSECGLYQLRFKRNTFSTKPTNAEYSKVPLAVVTKGDGRKVAPSMRKHEAQQDQLFEL